MNIAEKIYEHVKALPESSAREILHFIEFIETKGKLTDTDKPLIISNRIEKMRIARGLWADREDLPDIPKLRREWDREFDNGEL